MPLYELRAYIGALPRVLASEALRWVQVVGVGTGALKEHARGEILRGWERAASAGAPVVRPQTREGQVALARGAGIGVHVVPVRKAKG